MNWAEANTIEPLYRVKKLNLWISFFLFKMRPESLCWTGQKVKWIFGHFVKVKSSVQPHGTHIIKSSNFVLKIILSKYTHPVIG